MASSSQKSDEKTSSQADEKTQESAEEHKKSKANKKKLYEKAKKNKEALECRMYRKPWPEEGDILLCEVRSFAEDKGAYCDLLEYNGREGLLLFSELQRKRIRSVKGVIKKGGREVVTVLKLDREKGYIDLSRKRVTDEEKTDMNIKWNKSKIVHSIMKELCTLLQSKYTVKELYQTFGWKMYELFDHAYDGFKLMMNDREAFDKIIQQEVQRVKEEDEMENWEDDEDDIDGNKDEMEEDLDEQQRKRKEEIEKMTQQFQGIPPEFEPVLTDIIKKKLKPTLVAVRSTIELTCFTKHGVKGIRQALKNVLQWSQQQQELLKIEKNKHQQAASEQTQQSQSQSLASGDQKNDQTEWFSLKLIAPPEYQLTSETLEAIETMQFMKQFNQALQKEIAVFGGTIKIKEQPTIVNLDETRLALQGEVTEEKEDGQELEIVD